MSTMNSEMPLCFGNSGSVRASTPHQRANWPQEIHVFWPFSTQEPSRLDGRRAERREIGARLGLREPLRPQLLCREDRPHEARTLLVGPERENRRAEYVQTDDGRELGRACRGQLLVDDDLLRRRAAAAAELGRPRAADVTGLVATRLPAAEERHSLVEGVRDIRRVRRVLGEKRAHVFLELPLRRLERELHRRLKASDPPPRTTAARTPQVVTPTMISEMHATSG